MVRSVFQFTTFDLSFSQQGASWFLSFKYTVELTGFKLTSFGSRDLLPIEREAKGNVLREMTAVALPTADLVG
jgi:hypothetical protein